jgi:hypothetical protein
MPISEETGQEVVCLDTRTYLRSEEPYYGIVIMLSLKGLSSEI